MIFSKNSNYYREEIVATGFYGLIDINIFTLIPNKSGIMKNLLLKSLLFILISQAFLISCVRESHPGDKPNILFIFSDDQTYLGINALGNPEVITPALDRMVESGVTFTHAYNMGAWGGAVCVASRSMLNTGRMLFRSKEAHDIKYRGYNDGNMLWSKMLEQSGYDTYMTGKWHVSIGAKKIFNTVGTVRGGMPGTVPESYHRPLSEADTTWLPWHTKYGGFWEGGKHWSEIVADEAISFIDSSANSDNPFFMYVAFNAPHDPRQSPREYVEMYPLENISLPESFLEEYPYKVEMGCPPGLRDEMLAPFPRTDYSVRVHLQEYYAIITHMDQQIGRIIDHLKATGQDENTYILYSSDHGLGCGRHGLLGKQSMYDHSMRVPLLIIGPDIPENRKLEMQVYLQDLMATSLDLACVEKPEYVDFNSLMPLIDGSEKKSPYSEIYGAYTNRQRMIRSGSYKLIFYPEAGVYRLYDMLNDPAEINDLAGLPEKIDVIKDLASRFRAQQISLGDTLDIVSRFPDIFE